MQLLYRDLPTGVCRRVIGPGGLSGEEESDFSATVPAWESAANRFSWRFMFIGPGPQNSCSSSSQIPRSGSREAGIWQSQRNERRRRGTTMSLIKMRVRSRPGQPLQKHGGALSRAPRRYAVRLPGGAVSRRQRAVVLIRHKGVPGEKREGPLRRQSGRGRIWPMLVPLAGHLFFQCLNRGWSQSVAGLPLRF